MSGNGRYKISQKEVEICNLFSKLGYFAKVHIQIFPTDLRNQASDIDVLAIKFDRHLTAETILTEVKEGYGKVTTLFQIYGFKTYFSSSKTYLVGKEILDTTLQISKKLNIQAISFDRLNEIVEREVKFAEERKSTSIDIDREDVEGIIDFLWIIKNTNEELFWTYHYLWLEIDPYVKFYQLQNLFAKSIDLENQSKDEKLTIALSWYKQELFCLSLITAILIAYDSFNLKPAQISQYVMDKFYNIGTSKEGKLKVKQGVDILVEQLKKLSKGMIEVPPIEVIPSYVNDLILLVRFIINNAPYVQSYLLVDHNVQKTCLKGKPTRFNEFATSKVQFEKVKEMNSILLKTLYNGKPVSVTFKNFI